MSIPFHVGEFIKEEMEYRGWTLDMLAYAMTEEPRTQESVGLTLLTLEFLEIQQPNLFIGPEMAKGLSRAFGTSPEMWMNLDYRWQEANGGNVEEFKARWESTP